MNANHPEQLGGNVWLLSGDCLSALDNIKANSVDSCVTDPPYHLTSIVKRFSKTKHSDKTKTSERVRNRSDGYARLVAGGFMGQKWDGGDVAFRKETWEKVYRTLKPGAHLVAFCGTRNYHRLACAIEDAGFEIRDALLWLYGTGFPKSHDAGDGRGTALKPAVEIICLARKPLSEKSIIANIQRWGTGALNIDVCRVESERLTGWQGAAAGGHTWNDTNSGLTKNGIARPVKGRWPANVLLDGSHEVIAMFPNVEQQFDDGIGSAARFFYTAKADGDDRLGFDHPTVKPINLMQWLVRLVTPKDGMVLDLFAGTGTTGEAAWREKRKAILIERELLYQKMIQKRVKVMLDGKYARDVAKLKRKKVQLGALFG